MERLESAASETDSAIQPSEVRANVNLNSDNPSASSSQTMLQIPAAPPTFPSPVPMRNSLNSSTSVGGCYWPLNTALNQPHAFRRIHQSHFNGNPLDPSEWFIYKLKLCVHMTGYLEKYLHA